MEKSFTEILSEEASSGLLSVTENGALGFKTSGKNLLDLNFKISSYRGVTEKEIEDDFEKAFTENPILAVKFLFYASDVRQGLGERRFFKACLSWLANRHPEYIKTCLDLVPEYSRWDNLFCLIGTELEKEVIDLIKNQIAVDFQRMNWDEHKPVSLLGKWLPSINTSSKKTRNLARTIANKLGNSEKEYRKILSKLRKRIGIVESKMSAKEWSEINYEHVPSKANIKYSSAFLKNDESRRREFLSSLKKGESKINSSVNYPYEILHALKKTNERDTFEELWKNLPDYVSDSSERVITVVDGSGSMWSPVCGGSATAEEVARSIGIYFSERLNGEFKDKIITFSTNPQFINLSNCKSLYDKDSLMEKYNECSNTDIYKVFMLILNAAKKNNLKQNEIPNKILIISDMEFDSATGCFGHNSTLFEKIKQDYKDNGYSLPGLVFWNVCSRTGTFPVQKNENGLALVSGFSPSVASMVLSGKIEPFDVLLEKLNSDRYNEIEERLKDVSK